MDKQLLKDFLETAKQNNYDYDVVMPLFPELEGVDLQLLKDYAETAEQNNYDYDVVNSLFPELFEVEAEVKKKEDSTFVAPDQDVELDTEDTSSDTQTTLETTEYQPQNILEPIESEDAEFEASLKTSVTPDQISNVESFVVPEMQYKFGKYGFDFEESTTNVLGTDAMRVKVRGTNKDLYVKLDRLWGKDGTSKELEKFLRENKRTEGEIQKQSQAIIKNQRTVQTEEELNATVKLFNQQTERFKYEVDQYAKAQEEVDSIYESNFSNVSEEDRRNDPVLKANYDTWLKSSEALKVKLSQLEGQAKDFEYRGAKLDNIAGEYTVMKAKQGSWWSGFWNEMMGGSGPTFTPINALIDLTSYLDEKIIMGDSKDEGSAGKTRREEYKNDLIRIAKEKGLAPKGLSEDMSMDEVVEALGGDTNDVKLFFDSIVTKGFLNNPSMARARAMKTGSTEGGNQGLGKSNFDIVQDALLDIERKTKKYYEPKVDPSDPEGKRLISARDRAFTDALSDDPKFRNPFSVTGAQKDNFGQEGMVSAGRKAFDYFKDKSTTQQWSEVQKQGNFWKKGFLGLGGSLPAMLGSSSPLGWTQRTAQMYNMSTDYVDVEMEKNPMFDKISESEKTLVKMPIGIATAVLENIGLRNIISQKGLLNSVVKTALLRSNKNTTAKTFQEFIRQDIQNLFGRGALVMVGGGLAEFETGFAQEIATITVKDVYNASKNAEMFETPDTFAAYMNQVVDAGLAEMVGGFVMGSIPATTTAFSGLDVQNLDPKIFEIFEKTIQEPTLKSAYISGLKNRIANPKDLADPVTAMEELDLVNQLEGLMVANRVPFDSFNTNQRKEALQLLLQKETLENEIKVADKALSKPKQDLLDRVNKRLATLTSQAITTQEETEEETQGIKPFGIQEEEEDKTETETKKFQDKDVVLKEETFTITDKDGSYYVITVKTNLDGSLNPAELENFDADGNSLRKNKSYKLADNEIVVRDGLTVEQILTDQIVEGEVISKTSERSGDEINNPKKTAKLTTDQTQKLGVETETDTKTKAEVVGANPLSSIEVSEDYDDIARQRRNKNKAIIQAVENNDITSDEGIELMKESFNNVKEAQRLFEIRKQQRNLAKTNETTTETEVETDLEIDILENDIENDQMSLETFQEEIIIEKDNFRGEAARIKEEKAKIRKDKKLSKDQKAEAIEEKSAEQQDLKEEMDGVIETYREDIKEKQREIRKSRKAIAKIKKKATAKAETKVEPKVETKAEPKVETKVETKVEDDITEDEKTDIKDFFKGELDESVEPVSSNLSINKKGKPEKINNLKQRVIKVAKASAKAIVKLIPNTKIVLHESQAEYFKYTGKKGRGFYDTKDDIIHINLTSAKLSTVPHEVFHAVLLSKVKTDAKAREMAIRMVESVKKTLPKSSKLYKEIEAFSKLYTGDQAQFQEEEFIAELIGLMSSQEFKNYNQLKAPAKFAIIEFFKKIAKKFGIKLGSNFGKNDQSVIDLINVLATKTITGEEITEQDVEILNGDVSGVIDASAREAKSVLTDFTLQRFPTNPNIILKENTPLSNFNQKKSNLLESDRMTGAFIADALNNPIFKFFGGIYFPQITGKWWASRTLSKANSIAENMNANRDKDGYIYATPIIMKPNSHMSNQDMFETVWEFMKFDLRSKSSKVTKKLFSEYLNKALTLKSVNLTESDLNIKKSDNIETMISKLNNVLLGKEIDNLDYDSTKPESINNSKKIIKESTLSFEKRKAIIKAILGDPKVTEDRKFPTAGSISEVASKFEEEKTKQATKLWDVVMLMRTKGTLSTKVTLKSDEFYHKSYPSEISSDQEIEVFFLDGAYNIDTTYPELTQSSGKVFSWKEYSEKHPSAAFALSQYGRTAKLSKASGDIVAAVKPEIKEGREQIIGKNAELSQNIKDNLSVAKQMEKAKKSVEDIRIQTGWERGVDGKWRYEIDDGVFDLSKIYGSYETILTDKLSYKGNGVGLKNRIIQRILDRVTVFSKNNRESFQSVIDGKTTLGGIKNLTQKELDGAQIFIDSLRNGQELNAKEVFKTDKNILNLKTNLGSILDSSLLEMYPQLSSVSIDIKIPSYGMSPSKISQSYSVRGVSKGGLIEIIGRNIGQNPEESFKKQILEIESVLLHEIQHEIQNIEGFGRGGNTEMFESEMDTLSFGSVNALYSFATDVSKANPEKGWDITYSSEAVKKYETIFNEKPSPTIVTLASLLEQEISRGKSLLETEVYKTLKDNNLSSFEKYQRLAGEVEARNVQKRASMTPEQRKNTTLKETEDVAREDQTVILLDDSPQSREQKSTQEIINEGREDNFTEANIRDFLVRVLKRPAIEVNELMSLDKESLKTVPKSFTNVQGGIKAGTMLYNKVEEYRKKLVKKNEKLKGKKRLTKTEIVDQTIEYLQKQPEYINEGDKYTVGSKKKGTQETRVRKGFSTQQARMLADYTKTAGVRPTNNMGAKIRAAMYVVKQKVKGARDLQKQKTALRNFIRQSLPKALYTKKDVIDLVNTINDVNEANIDNLMKEVIQFVNKTNSKSLLATIKSILDNKYSKVESGRKKPVKISDDIRKRIEFIKSNMLSTKATIEEIGDALLNLKGRFDELAAEVQQTEDIRSEMVDLELAMLYNNALQSKDTSEYRVEQLDTVVEALKQMIEEGKSELREQIKEQHQYYLRQFEMGYESITGEKVDMADPEAFNKLNKFKKIYENEKAKRDTQNVLIKFFRGIKEGIDRKAFGSSEDLFTLMDRMDKLPGEMYGGNLQEMFTDRVDESSRLFKGRMMLVEQLIQNHLQKVYGKKWQKASRQNRMAKDLGIMIQDGVPLSPKSQNQIAYLYNMYKDPENRKSFANPEMYGIKMAAPDATKAEKAEIQAINEENAERVMSEMIAQLDSKVKETADWQVSELYPFLYNHYNDAYKKLYRTDLPWSEFYAGTIYREGVDQEEASMLDLQNAKNMYSTAVGAQGTKVRLNSSKPIKTMDMMDVLNTYLNQMEYLAAYGEVVRDMSKLFNNKYISDAIIKIHGKDIYNYTLAMIDKIASRGTASGSFNNFINAMNNVFILSRLALSPVIMIKQQTSFITYANDIGPLNYLKYAAKNKLEMLKVYKEIKENSVYMKDREGKSIMRAIETYSDSNMKKFVPAGTKEWIVNFAMWTTKFGDKSAIYIGGMPNYSYYKAQFKKNNPKATEQEAIDHAVRLFERDTKRTQQSGDLQDKDYYQTKDPLYRGLNMFLTTPKQYLRKEIFAIRNLNRKLNAWDRKAGKGTVTENIRTFIMYHVIMPVFFQYVSMGLPGILRDKRDDDYLDLLRAAMIGNLNALFIVGDLFQMAGDLFTGKPWAGSNIKTVGVLSIAGSLTEKLVYAEKLKDPVKKAEAYKKVYLELATLVGVPAPTIGKFVENYGNIGKGGDIGKDILRLLNFSKYQIEGPSKGGRPGKVKTIPELNREYDRRKNKESKFKTKSSNLFGTGTKSGSNSSKLF
jgi:hypothetical protein